MGFAVALAAGALLTLIGGCSLQGEGERCSLQKNGNADCDEGLVCTAFGGFDRCCPPEGEPIGDARCREPMMTSGGSGGMGTGGGGMSGASNTAGTSGTSTTGGTAGATSSGGTSGAGQGAAGEVGQGGSESAGGSENTGGAAPDAEATSGAGGA